MVLSAPAGQEHAGYGIARYGSYGLPYFRGDDGPKRSGYDGVRPAPAHSDDVLDSV
jgi:hypothetical protein